MPDGTFPVGIIGLGAMGAGIAENLAGKGWPVHVFDVQQERVDALVAKGAKAAASHAELGAAVEAVLLLLPMAPWDGTLERVVRDPGGIRSTLRKGATVLDGGNTSPQLSRVLHDSLAEAGINFIDAPVSGGGGPAKDGTLTIMVGASEDMFARHRRLFDDMGSKTIRFGEVTAGQTAKLLNNVLCSINLASLSEMMVLADKCGIDVEPLVDIICGSSGGSWAAEVYGRALAGRTPDTPKLIRGGWPGYRAGGKDRQMFDAMQIAYDLEVPVPVTNAAYSQFLMARGAGKVGLFEPIIEMLEDMTGTSARGERFKTASR